MNAIKALRLFSLLALVLTLSSGPSTSAAADLSVGQQAFHNGDYATALKELLPLARQGNSLAQSYVGFLYENGKGVQQDYAEAIRWYRLAAGHGVIAAQHNLASMYDTGKGVPQDYTKAIRWYRLAAEQGYADAQLKLGNRYFGGQGVPEDYRVAARWVRLAAERGHPEAQLLLGVIYEDGRRGLPQDRVQAHVWYNLAGANGNFEGIKSRDLIAQKMTAAEIAKAQQLAREWKRMPIVEAQRLALELRPKVDTTEIVPAPAAASRPAVTATTVDAPSTLDRPPTSRFAYQVHSIRDAENAGWVRTSYRSPTGSSSGDSVILIVVKMRGPEKLALSIPPGLALLSPLVSSQSMVISGLKGRDLGGGKYTPVDSILLTDDKPVRYVVEAYCAEFHKDNPPPDRFDFQVVSTPDPTVPCILREARKEKLSIAGTQAAVWIHTDDVTFPEMNTRMAIGKDEWGKAETVVSRCTSK